MRKKSGGSPTLSERGEHIATISSSLRTGRSAVPGFVGVAETLRQRTGNRKARVAAEERAGPSLFTSVLTLAEVSPCSDQQAEG